MERKWHFYVNDVALRRTTSFCSSTRTGQISIFHLFSLGWTSVGKNCTPTAWFIYRPSEEGFSSIIDGVYSIYHGGGYTVEFELDLLPSQEIVSKLERWKWIDRYTRFVVLESTVFNVNSRLFSRLKTYLEISQAGQVLSNHISDSMRLYPFVEIGDYVTLVAQLMCIVITIVRFLLFVFTMTKCRFTAAAAFNTLVELLRLILALGYIAFYIWRIDRTIYAVEVLMNKKGKFILVN